MIGSWQQVKNLTVLGTLMCCAVVWGSTAAYGQTPPECPPIPASTVDQAAIAAALDFSRTERALREMIERLDRTIARMQREQRDVLRHIRRQRNGGRPIDPRLRQQVRDLPRYIRATRRLGAAARQTLGGIEATAPRHRTILPPPPAVQNNATNPAIPRPPRAPDVRANLGELTRQIRIFQEGIRRGGGDTYMHIVLARLQSTYEGLRDILDQFDPPDDPPPSAGAVVTPGEIPSVRREQWSPPGGGSNYDRAATAPTTGDPGQAVQLPSPPTGTPNLLPAAAAGALMYMISVHPAGRMGRALLLLISPERLEQQRRLLTGFGDEASNSFEIIGGCRIPEQAPQSVDNSGSCDIWTRAFRGYTEAERSGSATLNPIGSAEETCG